MASLIFAALIPFVVIRENRHRDKVYGESASNVTEQEANGNLPVLTDQTDGENKVFRYVW